MLFTVIISFAAASVPLRTLCMCLCVCVCVQGNLSPNGAIIKPSAATPALLQHTGRAVVFESFEHMRAQVDSPDLVVDETSVLVLKGCGPRGYPGFPEVYQYPVCVPW